MKEHQVHIEPIPIYHKVPWNDSLDVQYCPSCNSSFCKVSEWTVTNRGGVGFISFPNSSFPDILFGQCTVYGISSVYMLAPYGPEKCNVCLADPRYAYHYVVFGHWESTNTEDMLSKLLSNTEFRKRLTKEVNKENIFGRFGRGEKVYKLNE